MSSHAHVYDLDRLCHEIFIKDENNQKCPHLYIDSYDEQTLVCSHNEELGWIHIFNKQMFSSKATHKWGTAQAILSWSQSH